MSTPSCPVELVRMILEYLDGGQWFSVKTDTLGACSRVCRTWKDIAQPILCRRIHLYTHERFDLFHDFLEANARIASFMHELVFSVSFSEDLYPLPPWLLLEILKTTPNIRCVCLQGITLLGWPLYTPMPPVPFKLHRLVISDIQNGPYHNEHCARLDFLRLFTDVDELVIAGSAIGEESDSDDDSERGSKMTANRRGIPLPVVRKLSIADPDCFLEYNDKCGGLDRAALQTLDIVADNRVAVRYAGKMLRRYGANIRDLRLNLCHAVKVHKPKDARIWNGLEMGKLTTVARLTLHVRANTDNTNWEREEMDREFCKAYTAVLSAVPTGTLRELTLLVPIPQEEDAFFTLAQSLAAIMSLAVERFSTLSMIVLVVSRKLTFDQCAAILCRALPAQLLDRDMIRFEYWGLEYIGLGH
ncbi:hypothetical protein VTO73DRAFT_14861 [Trametes versicolor]